MTEGIIWASVAGLVPCGDGARALARFNLHCREAQEMPGPLSFRVLKRRERRAPLASASGHSLARISIGLFLLFVTAFLFTAQGGQVQRETDFNDGWKFALQDAPDASQSAFDDSAWNAIRVPHDWSVNAAFSKDLEGATAYLPGGIGWYRKHFSTLPGATERVTYLHFDGVYNNAEFWLNGEKLGAHPYGYSPFYFDISARLRTNGAANVLAVRVDRSRYVDSRWYPGAGIYRDVTLVSAGKLHVPVWGVFVTTPEISEQRATAALEVRVKNDFATTRAFQLTTEIFNPAGKKVAARTDTLQLAAGAEEMFPQRLEVRSPQRWDTEQPRLYTAVTTITADGAQQDRCETRFGFRTLRFDAERGFFLNGKHTLIKGVCLHHDGGLVGAAVPKGVWARRLATLKAGGCNAIRSSHNPPSREFLELCDEMGFLVQNEFFDELDYPKDKRLNCQERHADYISRGYTEHFQQWGKRDLEAILRRDRNHPSVFMWSIGNEIEWTYPQYRAASGYFDMDWSGNYFWTPPRFLPDEMKRRYDAQPPSEHTLADTAKKLSAWTKALDATRPVVANMILPSVSHVSGYGDALDVFGYSYRRVVYDYGHTNFPGKMIMGTENVGQWHEWKAVIERPFIGGIFLWTGIDYLGESHDQWPTRSTGSGLLDTAGFAKPSWQMMKTLWRDEPHVYLATQTAEKSPYRLDAATGQVVEKKPGAWEHALWHWHKVNEHWNYDSNETVIAEVYSNCEEVELFLNGKSLGLRRLADFPDRIYKWAVPFAAGKLVAKGKGPRGTAAAALVTAAAPAQIVLTADKKKMKADGREVVHVVAQLADRDGNLVRAENRKLHFTVTGGGKIRGVDTGAADNVQDFQSDKIVTDKGHCLLLVEATAHATTLTITAHADGLKCKPIRVSCK